MGKEKEFSIAQIRMGQETGVIPELEISRDPDEKILDVGGLKPEGKAAYTTLETWHVKTCVHQRCSTVVFEHPSLSTQRYSFR